MILLCLVYLLRIEMMIRILLWKRDWGWFDVIEVDSTSQQRRVGLFGQESNVSDSEAQAVMWSLVGGLDDIIMRWRLEFSTWEFPHIAMLAFGTTCIEPNLCNIEQNNMYNRFNSLLLAFYNTVKRKTFTSFSIRMANKRIFYKETLPILESVCISPRMRKLRLYIWTPEGIININLPE